MADKKLPEDEVIRQVLVDLGDPIELAGDIREKSGI